jgi:hypothetical protein
MGWVERVVDRRKEQVGDPDKMDVKALRQKILKKIERLRNDGKPGESSEDERDHQFAAKDKTSAYGLSHHVYDRVRNLSRDGLRVTAPLLEPSGRAAEGRARLIHRRDVTDCGECTGLEKGDPSQGTEGSNPSPSSAESQENR